VIDNAEAVERLGGLCDALLWHDRPIERCVDDSVWIDMGDAPPLPVRRARGFVPAPIALPMIDDAKDLPDGLCVGGELKNTIAVVRGREAILSHHLGDLTHPLAFAHFKQAIADLIDLFGIEVGFIAHDLHPAYLSTAYARQLAEERAESRGSGAWGEEEEEGVALDDPGPKAQGLGPCLVPIQHHHAHAAAVMADHRVTDPVLAVVCDGVGYGTDGTVWGGELLLADLLDVRRMARLRPLRLAGGDAAAKDTRRCALALLHQAFGDDFDEHPAARRLIPDAAERRLLATMIRRNVNCVASSGAGRVFDGFAALLGVCPSNQFEAQSGIALEAMAAAVSFDADMAEREALFELREDEVHGGLRQIDLSPLVRRTAEQAAAGLSPPQQAELAAALHDQLARAWEQAVLEAAAATGVRRVVVSGGVFCNARLTRRLMARLQRHGLDVLRHEKAPPGDGGLSLGQAAIARARMAAEATKRQSDGATKGYSAAEFAPRVGPGTETPSPDPGPRTPDSGLSKEFTQCV